MEIKKVDVTANTIGNFSKEVSDEVGKPLGTIALGQFKKYETMDMHDAHIPFHATNHIVVKSGVFHEEAPEDSICEVEEEHTEPYFTGLSDASSPQGIDFDLASGVKAFDSEGNEIPFTYSPTSIAECELGEQTITYTAEGVTGERTITVTPIDEPTIHGLNDIHVWVDEEFDPMAGVTGTDGNGESVEVTYSATEYPYTLLTVGAWESQGGEWGGASFNDSVTPVSFPKAEYEDGEAVITNYTVDGVNYGTVTRSVSAHIFLENRVSLNILPMDELFGLIEISWVDGGEIISAYVDNEMEGAITPPYSWDSITVTMTGVTQ